MNISKYSFSRMIRSRKVMLSAFVIILVTVSVGCAQKEKIKIALSKGSGSAGYKAYSEWINSTGTAYDCRDLFTMKPEDALRELANCSGLVLTGGPDVNPGRYGRIADSAICEIDEKRDTLEFALIKKALELKLPILAICRGEQIFNVANGGTLIPDIPSIGDTMVSHQCPDPANCFHQVEIVRGSLLHKLSGVNEYLVNTNHHQAVEHIADGFVITACSKDGIIEAYEWKKPADHPFMMAVQWHPERLGHDHPLSRPILDEFLKNVLSYKKLARII